MNKGENNNPWWIPVDSDENNSHTFGFTPVDLTNNSVRKSRLGDISLSAALIFTLLAGLVGGIFGVFVGEKSQSVNFLNSHSVIERAPDSIASIAARISPSVVSILVQTDSSSDTGSGFFITPNGYILTNNHVIDAVASANGSIQVSLANGKTYPAKVIGKDTGYDLAVLKINVMNAPAMKLGNSDDVMVGDTVIAVGSPLGLAGTVTSGIISAKNRAVTAGTSDGIESSYINAIQTDAAINPGNSGGPLVNLAGEVVGVNSAIASLDSGSVFGNSQAGSIGLGFAIPINRAKVIAKELIKTGHASYPILGIQLDTNYTQGAKIADTPNAVKVGGPSAQAGLKPGDILLQIGDQTITSDQDAIVAIRSHNVGDQVKVIVSRNGQKLTFTVRLASAS